MKSRLFKAILLNRFLSSVAELLRSHVCAGEQGSFRRMCVKSHYPYWLNKQDSLTGGDKLIVS
jgi:hypothetical protein